MKGGVQGESGRGATEVLVDRPPDGVEPQPAHLGYRNRKMALLA